MNKRYSTSSQFCVANTCFIRSSPGSAPPPAGIVRDIFLRNWFGLEQLLQTIENRGLEDENYEHKTSSRNIQDAKD